MYPAFLDGAHRWAVELEGICLDEIYVLFCLTRPFQAALIKMWYKMLCLHPPASFTANTNIGFYKLAYFPHVIPLLLTSWATLNMQLVFLMCFLFSPKLQVKVLVNLK